MTKRKAPPRPPRLKDRCPQCGKQYRARACGPTHAFVAAGLVEIGTPSTPNTKE